MSWARRRLWLLLAVAAPTAAAGCAEPERWPIIVEPLPVEQRLVIDGARDRLDELQAVRDPVIAALAATAAAAGPDGGSPLAPFVAEAQQAFNLSRDPETLRAAVELAPARGDEAAAGASGGEELRIAIVRRSRKAAIDAVVRAQGGRVRALELLVLLERRTARVVLERESPADPRALVASIRVKPDGAELLLRSPALERVLDDIERDLYRPMAARLREPVTAAAPPGPDGGGGRPEAGRGRPLPTPAPGPRPDTFGPPPARGPGTAP